MSSVETPRPLVSIIAINYNGAAHVERYLAGVRGSDYEPLELIVVDNASSDDSAARFAAHAEARVVESPERPRLRPRLQPRRRARRMACCCSS